MQEAELHHQLLHPNWFFGNDQAFQFNQNKKRRSKSRFDRLRCCRRADSRIRYAVTEELIEQWLVRISSGACGAVFVTEHDGEVAGFLNFHIVPLLQFSGGLGRITAVGVGSRFRHLGVGRQLVAAAEQFAWAHGCARVAATTSGHHPGASAFYEGLGYEFEARRFLKSRPVYQNP
jgi:GNAT superfamily N-acetyltransferase